MTHDVTQKVDPLIPLLDAFRMAGVGTTKGYEEINAGRLKAVHNGRRRFVRMSELRRYIDALEAVSLEGEAA
jgi:hypothetical protein